MNSRRKFAAAAVGSLAACLAAIACSSQSGPVTDAGVDAAPDGTLRDASAETGRDSGSADGKTPNDSGRDSGPSDGGPPYLTTLTVTATDAGDGAAPYTLVPAFSPSIFDYYVRCNAGVNDITVSMTASKGAVSELVAPDASAPAPTLTLALAVPEGAAISISGQSDNDPGRCCNFTDAIVVGVREVDIPC